MKMNVQQLKEQIALLYAKIKEIQDDCSHPKSTLEYVYGADTGNWCPSDDSYWTTYTCNLCEKRWTEEGSNKLPKCHR